MQDKNLFRSWRCWRRGLYIATLSLIILGIACVPDLHAQDKTVVVKVWIEESSWNSCGDSTTLPDIYWNVYIDGFKQSSVDHQIEVSWTPFYVGKEFPHEVALLKNGTIRTIPIVIEEYDADPISDEQCDINPNPNAGRALSLNLNLATCKITGDLSFDCDTLQSIEHTGSVDWFRFKISVEDPAHAPGLNVRCLHDPIWPQPGQAITITAEALDDDARLITAGTVDNIVVWINDNTTPYAMTAGTPAAGANSMTTMYTPPSGAKEFAYGCRVFDDGEGVYTGGRVVQIGKPAKGRAVPIVYTGPPEARIDIAFIPDEDAFAGEDEPGFPDPIFLTRVHDLIRDGYYAGRVEGRGAGRVFLTKQNLMNFWIALDTGDTDAYADLHPPTNWWKDYNFIDAGVLLHEVYATNTNSERQDFARRSIRIFTTDVAETNWQVLAPLTLLHESGHTPFGLSDEYCKTGAKEEAYFVPEPHPNVYDNHANCLADPLAANVADACQQIKDEKGCIVNYFRLEPASTFNDDLMTCSGHYTPNRADVERINWLFDDCVNADCD